MGPTHMYTHTHKHTQTHTRTYHTQIHAHTLLSAAVSTPPINRTNAVASAIERLRWMKFWIPGKNVFLL